MMALENGNVRHGLQFETGRYLQVAVPDVLDRRQPNASEQLDLLLARRFGRAVQRLLVIALGLDHVMHAGLADGQAPPKSWTSR